MTVIGKRKQKKFKTGYDEPRPEGGDWVEFGGQLIWAAGFTAGDAPYGVTEEEFRRANERHEKTAGWSQAKGVLKSVLALLGCDKLDDRIDYVKFLHEGLSYKVYTTFCRYPVSDQEIERRVVIRLPRADAPFDMVESGRRELKLLAHLASAERNLPIRVPRLLGGMAVPDGIAMVQEFMEGVRADKLSKSASIRKWELIADAAAVCHSIDWTPLRDFLPFYPTRREHALSALAILDRLDFPDASVARSWALDHLPPEEPSCLLHGDLLAQNLLVDPGGGPPAVLDWAEARIGDPAYDLAIVTRGARKLFGVREALTDFLSRYRSQSTIPVRNEEVRLYEICLLAGFYLDSCKHFGLQSPGAESYRDRFVRFLNRLNP